MFRKKQIIELLSMMVGVVLTVTMSACTPRAVREAESVVTQADSLWQAGKMYGVDEGDSVSLAQAYETLQKHSAFSRQLSEVSPFVPCTSLLRTYSHACYHYGKLLRAKDNPVEAMQVFIAATHSHTRDYHILGRVYSNMGSVCHLAGEYSLSYDMYEKSAHVFLQDGDSLSYYYLLNDMAFELAEQGKKEETLTLLSEIENHYTDNDVLAKVWETKANVYLHSLQYDSAIYCSQYLLQRNYFTPSTLIICAQAYSYLGIGDSATYFAENVLNTSSSLGDMNNALYILTNDDETKDKNAIRDAAADRADIQKLLEIRQGKLSQAVQLLEQYLHRKPDYRWLYAILVTLIIVGLSLFTYIYRKRRQHTLLSQKVEDLTIQNKEAETLHEKIISDLKNHKRTIADEIEQNCQIIIYAESFPQNIYWKDFNKMCAVIDSHLYMVATKLSKKKVLNETEIRLCVLVLLNLSRAEISKTLPYALSSVGKLKDQTAKKLNTTGKNLRDYLIKIAVE